MSDLFDVGDLATAVNGNGLIVMFFGAGDFEPKQCIVIDGGDTPYKRGQVIDKPNLKFLKKLDCPITLNN